jgi:cell division protein FtsB
MKLNITTQVVKKSKKHYLISLSEYLKYKRQQEKITKLQAEISAFHQLVQQLRTEISLLKQ